jgi:hypothetical protein
MPELSGVGVSVGTVLPVATGVTGRTVRLCEKESGILNIVG